MIIYLIDAATMNVTYISFCDRFDKIDNQIKRINKIYFKLYFSI